MLLQGHDLQDVIAQVSNLGQHVTAEVLEAGDLLRLGAHADVAFINQGMGTLPCPAMAPDIGLRRIPDLGAEDLRLRILDAAGRIGWQTLRSTAGPFDEDLVQGPVMQQHRGNAELPVPVADGFEGPAPGPVPVVAIADEIDARCIGRPFAEHPGAVRFPVQAVIQVVVDARGERAVHGETVPAGGDASVAGVDGVLEGHQVRVRVIYHLGLHRLPPSIWFTFSRTLRR